MRKINTSVDKKMARALLTPGASPSPIQSSGFTTFSTVSSPTFTWNVMVWPFVNFPRKGPLAPNASAFFASNFPRMRGPTTTYARVGLIDVEAEPGVGDVNLGSWLWKPTGRRGRL